MVARLAVQQMHLVVYPAGSAAKTPAMNSEDKNHSRIWLSYLQ